MKKIKVFIKEIESFDYHTGHTRVNWFHVQLKSGRVIQIFDDYPFDLRNYLKKYIYILLYSGSYSLHDKNRNIEQSKIFEGKFEKTYQLPLEWKDANWASERSYQVYREEHNILNIPDGIIILGEIEKRLEKNGIKEGDKITIDFGRINLISWYPVEK